LKPSRLSSNVLAAFLAFTQANLSCFKKASTANPDVVIQSYRAVAFPGAKQSDGLVLRSLGDCRAVIERARVSRRALVLGASFIGLEVAASLRARNIEVHVVAPRASACVRVSGLPNRLASR
jgi:Pyridine nucleotide-disulphide oxidoreductase